jgi:hypothetical protein
MLVRPLNRTLVSALLTAVMTALVLPTTSAPDVDLHHLIKQFPRIGAEADPISDPKRISTELLFIGLDCHSRRWRRPEQRR